MKHRFGFLWVPLLAALLTGPAGLRAPAWSQESAVGRIDAAPAVVGLVRPLSLHQLGRQQPSPTDRHAGPPWANLPATVAPVAAPVVRDLPLPAPSQPPAETARHFPLFPTGPPSHD